VVPDVLAEKLKLHMQAIDVLGEGCPPLLRARLP
jgi:hypothetical protein